MSTTAAIRSGRIGVEVLAGEMNDPLGLREKRFETRSAAYRHAFVVGARDHQEFALEMGEVAGGFGVAQEREGEQGAERGKHRGAVAQGEPGKGDAPGAAVCEHRASHGDSPGR